MMKYETFVKEYYKLAMEKLRKHESYCGLILDSNRGIDFDEKHYRILPFKYPIPNFLPRYELKETAPVEKYEEFMEYYGTLCRELSTVLLPKDRLKGFHKEIMKALPKSRTNTYLALMDAIITLNINTLVEDGVLSHSEDDWES